MGCLKSKEAEELPPVPMKEPEVQTIDSRLPFDNYRQLFNMKNSWKAVSRSMEKVAKDSLLRFFKMHPEHKKFHSKLKDIEDEDKLLNNTNFELSAVNVFNVLDEVMSATDKVDIALAALNNAGRYHAKIEGFEAQYFKDMEKAFIEAVKFHLEDRFTEATENNFREFWNWCIDFMIKGFNEAKK